MAIIGSALGGPPVVVHVHDAIPDGFISRCLCRVLLARSEALIAISSYTKERFLGDMKDSGRPFPILYNPINSDRLDPASVSRIEARKQLGLDPEGVFLGIVGQITPWKGHDVAIRTLAEVRKTYPNARLLIVGKAKFVARSTRLDNLTFERKLSELSVALGVSDAVEFWGERSDVPLIMRALDVLLMPSWAEPLGRTMLEAMCVATPVVATTIGGPAEVIEHGKTGLLADPRAPEEWIDAALLLLGDPAISDKVAQAGRDSVADRFDRYHYAQVVLSFYETLLAARGTRERA